MGLKITFGVLLILGSGVLLLIGICGSMFNNRDLAVTGGMILGLLLFVNGIVLLVRCTTPTAPSAGAAAIVLLCLGVFGAFTGVLNAIDGRRSDEALWTVVIVGSGLALVAGMVLVFVRGPSALQRHVEDAFYDDDDDPSYDIYHEPTHTDLGRPDGDDAAVPDAGGPDADGPDADGPDADEPRWEDA